MKETFVFPRTKLILNGTFPHQYQPTSERKPIPFSACSLFAELRGTFTNNHGGKAAGAGLAKVTEGMLFLNTEPSVCPAPV